MEYFLMHQSLEVAEITIDEDIASIVKIGDVYKPEHIPVGISFKDGRPYRSDLNDWWRGRSIPASRQNLRNVMDDLKVSSAEKLLTKCFGLSLSDQYWINPVANSLDWEKINFFDNSFSDDVGDTLFGNKPQNKILDLKSPDNTSDGWLKKKWKIINGKRCLIKGGSNPFQQEPFNEVFAASVMRRLGIDHVSYDIYWENGLPYSVCEGFITRETELVSAYYLHNTKKITNVSQLYEHFLDCCSELGIPNARDGLNKMLTLDFLIANRDRHLTNFGAVRNARTLEWIGLAPVYDSGTSLWNDLIPEDFDYKKTASKPFLETHEEQAKLINDFSWLDFSDFYGIEDDLKEILSVSNYVNETRSEALCSAVKKRVDLLRDIINS